MTLRPSVRRLRGSDRGEPATVPDIGPSRADRYVALTARLDILRAGMSAEGSQTILASQVRAEHRELARLLGEAVSDAFAAETVDAGMPPGVTSWSAEGLARSKERELALLAATDVMGVARAMTVPSPRWGGSGE
jgi:hypothetical protein